MSDAFPQTYWTILRRPDRTALNRIARDYAAPVRRFIERAGFPPEDAEDLAQEVFCVVCDPEFLTQADAKKGRFRTLVLLVVKNVMNMERRKRFAKKRAGPRVSLDSATVADLLAAPEPEDSAFDVEWWSSLLEDAIAALREEHPRRHEILQLHKKDGKSHAEIAKELRVGAEHVNNEIRAAKKRVREILLSRVQAYCSTDGEYRAEVDLLRKALGSS